MASVPESAVVANQTISADPEMIGPDPNEGGSSLTGRTDSGGGVMHDCHDEIEAEEIAERESSFSPALPLFCLCYSL